MTDDVKKLPRKFEGYRPLRIIIDEIAVKFWRIYLGTVGSYLLRNSGRDRFYFSALGGIRS